MREALYHPEHGYYSRHIRNIGARGDFSTSATLHPILGRAIARWALQRRGRVRRGREWHVIEIGGGSGRLAEAFLEALGWVNRRGLNYHLVDVSPGLQTLQRQRLERFEVRQHATVAGALQAAGGSALIFSNELVDAFPCKQLLWTEEGWREILLVLEADGAISEQTTKAPLPEELRVCSAVWLPHQWRPGHRCEIHPAYREWFRQWLPAWEQGCLLLIDYGDVYPAVGEDQPQGSLRAYFNHETLRGAEVYQRFGRQDLTADVNFTDLIAWGEEEGLTTEFFKTQREFILETYPALGRPDRGLPKEAAFIMDPEGMGQAFKVLCQGRFPRR